ncbi:hypothetical protein RM553_04995 [Zunongwangia sp. F363]|uniref:DUF7793 domain-containing protein n=1 Tax=Autumnicola tepida TaxID=3075595 RepID=A0ABU3C774_9FLAO|nr:hypothetical protein [Zunongwangia sp. F363]MDT0642184.1 hypothetical protein [Zunongwangia sp. F363]
MNYIRNEYAELYIEEGILYFTYLPFEKFDIDVAEKIVSDRLLLQKEVSFPILCDIRQLTLPTLRARRFLALKGSVLAKAVAYWTDSMNKEYMTQFFIAVDRPLIPTAIFVSRADALKYLKAFVE